MIDPVIRWNDDAFGQVHRLESLQKALNDIAKRGADAGGPDYVAREGVTPDRARAVVITANIEGIEDNARNHTLLGRVVDAMRS